MFFSEIYKMVGLDKSNITCGYNIIDFNGQCLYIDGIKKILLLTNKKIAVEFSNCIAYIQGELNTDRLEDDSLIIKGYIESINKELKVTKISPNKKSTKKEKNG